MIYIGDIYQANPDADHPRRTVVHGPISSRLDYCNSLLFGISGNLLSASQAVQNAAARLVTGTRRRENITSVLKDNFIGYQ